MAASQSLLPMQCQSSFLVGVLRPFFSPCITGCGGVRALTLPYGLSVGPRDRKWDEPKPRTETTYCLSTGQHEEGCSSENSPESDSVGMKCGGEATREVARARCDIQAQHTNKMQTSFLILESPTAPGAWVQLHFHHCNFEILTRVWTASFFF